MNGFKIYLWEKGVSVKAANFILTSKDKDFFVRSQVVLGKVVCLM